MKRFLLLFCSVVLVCSIMVVPAFAVGEPHYVELFVVGNEIQGEPPGWLPLASDELFDITVSAGDYSFTFYGVPLDILWELPYDDPIYGDDYVFVEFYVEDFEDSLDFCFGMTFRKETLKFDNVDGCPCDLKVGETWFSDFTVIIASTDLRQDPEPVTGGSLLSGVFGVFGGVGSWIIAQLGSLTSIFWNADAGALTFLGVLAVAALALAVILLLAFVVVRFLRFRG